MKLAIEVEPNITQDGIEYMTPERELLTQLATWNCYPYECATIAFDSMIEAYPERAYYSFMRLSSGDERGVFNLYIPDDHPSAMMSKLRWGGV